MTAAEIIVDIPAEGKYTVQITSSSPVSADISVEKLKVSHTEIPEAVMDFYGIEVSDKDDVTLCFGEDITLDQNGENIPADNSCEGNVPIYTVMTESVGNGMCYGSGKFRKGEKVTVYADSSFMENFLGWFDGEALVSKSASYSFAVEDYTHLYAKFSEKVSLMGDINKDRKVNSDDLSMLLEKYAATDSSCDLDRNGVVNSADLSMLLGNFGKAL